jgi:predicted dehydrogenase
MFKIAFIGTNEGNGHIFSWSAIINGDYDRKLMEQCGYPVIPGYLNKQPKENLGISGARVTHVWTENPDYARRVASTTYIEHVVDRPEDVIGKVDGVVITTDIGETHLPLARPFIESGLPVFVDKPLADNESDLRAFCRYVQEGRPVASSSCLRYAHEITELPRKEIGRIEFVNCIMAKSWERYGVHAMEGVYAIIGGGIESVFNIGVKGCDVVLVEYKSGQMAVLDVVYHSQIFGRYDIFGEQKTVTVEATDYFHMFKSQLVAVVKFLTTRKHTFPFSETVEIIKTVIAGIKSRNEKRKIHLKEIHVED